MGRRPTTPITVQDYKAKKDNFAVRNANGTGPYALVSREQDVQDRAASATMAYWGKGRVPLGVTDDHLSDDQSRTPTRVAALLSGEVDFVQDVPVQDIDRAGERRAVSRSTSGRRTAPSSSAWMSASPELATSNVKGKNPFADKRVRQAINMAIDREAIKRAVMRGQSVPAGIIAPPFVNGYTKELDAAAQGRPRQGQGAAQGRRLSGRLPGHAPLPQRPLHQRRGHLPGRHRPCWPRSASR